MWKRKQMNIRADMWCGFAKTKTDMYNVRNGYENIKANGCGAWSMETKADMIEIYCELSSIRYVKTKSVMWSMWSGFALMLYESSILELFRWVPGYMIIDY